MSEDELRILYQQLQNCLLDVSKVTKRLDLLEEEKDKLTPEEYLERFDTIARQAQKLNNEKRLIGRKIEELSSRYE